MVCWLFGLLGVVYLVRRVVGPALSFRAPTRARFGIAVAPRRRGFETCPLLGPDPGGCLRSDGYPAEEGF